MSLERRGDGCMKMSFCIYATQVVESQIPSAINFGTVDRADCPSWPQVVINESNDGLRWIHSELGNDLETTSRVGCQNWNRRVRSEYAIYDLKARLSTSDKNSGKVSREGNSIIVIF